MKTGERLDRLIQILEQEAVVRRENATAKSYESRHIMHGKDIDQWPKCRDCDERCSGGYRDHECKPMCDRHYFIMLNR